MIISYPIRRSASDSGGAASSKQSWQSEYLDKTTDALLVLEVETGLLVGFNNAASSLLGYPADKLIGQHFSALLPPLTANPKTPVGRRFPLVEDVSESQIFQHHDGHEVVCDVLVTAVRATPSELAVLHLRDVRTRESIRQAIRDTDKAALATANSEDVVRAIEQYMSHVSHELRTPLAVILSSSSMLERYYNRISEIKREEHFTRIQMQVKYMTAFLDDLRFLSRLDANHVQIRREVFDTVELIQEMINEFGGHPKQPHFDLKLDGTLEKLTIDGILWRRALLPVIHNAVKYGHSGGDIHISLMHDGRTLQSRVSDNGPGLPSDYLAAPFTVFRRGDNVGDEIGGGLGLAIASRCAALLGGTLTFETEAGFGTTFTLAIPAE